VSKSKDKLKDGDNDAEMAMGVVKDDELEEIDQKDDGYIELVLRVLARMCDGQHKGLQVRAALHPAGSFRGEK